MVVEDRNLENLRVDTDDGIARVTLDTEARSNPLTPETVEELLEVAVALNEDDGVRCVVLTGAGDFFCSGFNLSRLEGGPEDGATLREGASKLHDAIVQLHQADAPVVVGVNGVAAGAGFSLAILGDVVLMSDEARLDYAYTRVGLTGDGGSTFFLPRLVGLRRAAEIVLLDRSLDAQEAAEMGLVTEAVSDEEFDERLDELAHRIADGPTKAYGATKRLLTRSFDRSLEEQLAAETDALAKATHTEDYARGHAAFFGDEEPEFAGE